MEDDTHKQRGPRHKSDIKNNNILYNLKLSSNTRNYKNHYFPTFSYCYFFHSAKKTGKFTNFAPIFSENTQKNHFFEKITVFKKSY